VGNPVMVVNPSARIVTSRVTSPSCAAEIRSSGHGRNAQMSSPKKARVSQRPRGPGSKGTSSSVIPLLPKSSSGGGLDAAARPRG
jgi:hypothetical protein